MRAAFTLGGLELAMSVPAGDLEGVVLELFSPYLGAIRAPVAWVSVEPMVGSRSGDDTVAEVSEPGDGTVSLSHPWFEGELRLGGRGRLTVARHRRAVDYCFQVLWATLALSRGSMLVAASGAVSRGVAHVFLGDARRVTELSVSERRPVLSVARIALHPGDEGWLASSTPFALAAPPHPVRVAPLAALWVTEPGEDTHALPLRPTSTVAAVLEHGLVAARETDQRRALFAAATEVAGAVPAGVLRLGPKATWARIDELAAALELRRALVAWEEPALRARVLAHSLPGPPPPDGRGRKRSARR